MQRRGESTRTHIKTSAIKEFCLKGYDAASVADICVKAGVSKGAFYHHFSSKQELFLAIMQDWLDGIDVELAAQRNSGKKVPQQIMDMGGTMGHIFNEASGKLPMFMEFMVQASRDEEIWKAVIAPYELYRQSFSKLISRGIKEGSFKVEADADVAALVLISLAIGVLLQGVVNPEASDWENVMNKGVQMILKGLVGREA